MTNNLEHPSSRRAEKRESAKALKWSIRIGIYLLTVVLIFWSLQAFTRINIQPNQITPSGLSLLESSGWGTVFLSLGTLICIISVFTLAIYMMLRKTWRKQRHERTRQARNKKNT